MGPRARIILPAEQRGKTTLYTQRQRTFHSTKDGCGTEDSELCTYPLKRFFLDSMWKTENKKSFFYSVAHVEDEHHRGLAWRTNIAHTAQPRVTYDYHSQVWYLMELRKILVRKLLAT